MTDYYISTDRSLLDAKKILQLLKECFWCKNIPLDYINRFVNFSLCFGVYQKSTNNQLVGFGRVISDYTTYAYICDVVIEAQHRRKGLGNQLIKTILAHPDLQGLKTWSLRTTEEARAIYLSNGFNIAEQAHSQLEINDLDIYTNPDFCNRYAAEFQV